jgi:hypothetical protein
MLTRGYRALRKTAHLLLALSDALPPALENAANLPPPITYHPLDLSYPELARTLGQMNEKVGDKLAGRVACVGLHGDYDAGLQLIREGKLHTVQSGKPEGGGRAPNPELQVAKDTVRNESLPDSIQVETPAKQDVPLNSSCPPSPAFSQLATPGPLESSLPSAIDEESSSSRGHGSDSASSGTWSPVYASGEEEITLPTPLSQNGQSRRPLHLVFLGSSLGNFDRTSAAPFLKGLPLGPGDTLLIGLDGRPAPGEDGTRKVEIAYNDPAGHTAAFEMHGWEVVEEQLGIKANMEFVGRYNESLGKWR